MKPTELRLNNYIFGIDRSQKIHIPIEQPLKILQIGVFNCLALPITESPAKAEEWIKLANSDITPIHLNLEWIERFGFYEDKETMNLLADYTICLERINDELFISGGLNNRRIYKIEFVHELQNIYFILTGSELIIKS